MHTDENSTIINEEYILQNVGILRRVAYTEHKAWKNQLVTCQLFMGFAAL